MLSLDKKLYFAMTFVIVPFMVLNNFVVKCATIQSPFLLSTSTNPGEIPKQVSCQTHSNCSSRILTLDTYCCPTSNFCCNWFEFAAKYKSESTLPLKAPSILTVLAILLLIICFLFVLYCFSILFCFCFKCGIFKRPKVVILTHEQNSDLDNNSPKHSSSGSSMSSGSSYTPNGRRSYRHVSPQNKHFKKKTQNKQRSRRSPTARAYSTKRPQYDSEIYVDFDSTHSNESPFLIPAELTDQVQHRIHNRSHRNPQTSTESTSSNSNRTSSHRVTNTLVPSAPLASDNNMHEIIEHRNILEPVIVSSLSTSSLSLNSNMNEEVHGLAVTATQSSVSTVQFQYNDDKPPSYDDIIKRNY